MQLINSKIIPASQNIFWEKLPESWYSLTSVKCLILTREYDSGSAEEGTLLKMLAACKLGPEQYHILKLAEGQQVAFHELKQLCKPEFVLLLGLNPADLGISALFRLNEPNEFNECVLLPSLSLSHLISMQDMRTALWQNGLKPVFAP